MGKDDQGCWQHDLNKIKEMAVNHFQSLFSQFQTSLVIGSFDSFGVPKLRVDQNENYYIMICRRCKILEIARS